MLIEFSVENYRSIRDKATLSMVAARKDMLQQNVHWQAQGTDFDLLKSVGVFGANASGKSNLLNAMHFMASFVRESYRQDPEGVSGIAPYRLDKKFESDSTSFEAVILVKGVRFVYGFSIAASRVEREWLSTSPKGQQRVLFDRNASPADDDPSFYFGPSWTGARNQLEKMVRPDALLLSVAAAFNHDLASQVYDWFSNRLRRVSWFPTHGSERQFTCLTTRKSKEIKERCLKFWKQADPAIQDFRVREIPMQESIDWRKLPKKVRHDLASMLPSPANMLDVKALRHGVNEHGDSIDVEFDFDDESDGTQKFFALAGPWNYVLDNGCVLIVDELDARLHPWLTIWLIQLFHNETTNPSGAQLVFSTHNESIMDRRILGKPLLRRDQIWFTEKDSNGATSLYSLWDFKKPPRTDENIRLGYLAGKYGAIPLIESWDE